MWYTTVKKEYMSRNKLYDKIVVIDLEATCDEPRPQWRGEIIEIGVCLLDVQSLEITKPKGILVKPQNTPITAFCTKLTTLTPELIEREGTSLFSALVTLQDEYKINQRTWASWGDYDRKQLVLECESKRMGFPGEFSTHLNLKSIIALEYGWRRENGLDRALEAFKMKLEGTHHRGVDDAVNIARVYREHLSRVRNLRSNEQQPRERP